MTGLSSIRSLLVSAQTAEALQQLVPWAEDQGALYRQAALLLQAAWANNEQQALQGLASYEETERVRNRISAGALKLLEEIESGASSPRSVLEGLQEQFLNAQVQEVLQNDHSSDFEGGDIQVQHSEDVIIGSGNTVTRKTIAGLGYAQFFSLLLGLLLLGVGGYYIFGRISAGQEAAYRSLQDIHKEMKLRADLDAGLAAQLEAGKDQFEIWLSEGMAALNSRDYATAVQYLEKVAEQAPLATVRQNLAYAYEQLGDTDKARENLAAAKEIDPNLDTGRSYAQLKGKRINLLAPENGRTFLVGSAENIENVMDGAENSTQFFDGSEITISFKEERAATFDQFAILITETSGFNLAEFELFAGNDSPTGAFSSLGKFTTQNMYFKQQRYQTFSFPEVEAKYFRFRILSSHGGNTYYPHVSEIQLWGKL